MDEEIKALRERLQACIATIDRLRDVLRLVDTGGLRLSPKAREAVLLAFAEVDLGIDRRIADEAPADNKDNQPKESL